MKQRPFLCSGQCAVADFLAGQFDLSHQISSFAVLNDVLFDGWLLLEAFGQCRPVVEM
jgi:hypothetical protein